MDADGFTGYLGIEYQMRQNLLVGLALTHSRGDLDYNHVKTRNTLVPSDYGITSLMPYVHVQVRPRLGIWGMAGYGRGSSDMRDLLGFHDADMSLMMGATGARQELSRWHGIGFAVKGDAFYVRTKSDGTARLPDVLVEAKRARLMIEGRRTLAFDPVLRFIPSVEIGGRWDRGHVENGAGIDVGGGFPTGSRRSRRQSVYTLAIPAGSPAGRPRGMGHQSDFTRRSGNRQSRVS